jgi:hypothetical protein
VIHDRKGSPFVCFLSGAGIVSEEFGCGVLAHFPLRDIERRFLQLRLIRPGFHAVQ